MGGSLDCIALASFAPCKQSPQTHLCVPLPSQAVCTACTAGQFCPSGTFLNNETDQSSIECAKGSYCPTPASQLPCPSGSYCVSGTVQPLTCSYQQVGLGRREDGAWMGGRTGTQQQEHPSCPSLNSFGISPNADAFQQPLCHGAHGGQLCNSEAEGLRGPPQRQLLPSGVHQAHLTVQVSRCSRVHAVQLNC